MNRHLALVATVALLGAASCNPFAPHCITTKRAQNRVWGDIAVNARGFVGAGTFAIDVESPGTDRWSSGLPPFEEGQTGDGMVTLDFETRTVGQGGTLVVLMHESEPSGRPEVMFCYCTDDHPALAAGSCFDVSGTYSVPRTCDSLDAQIHVVGVSPRRCESGVGGFKDSYGCHETLDIDVTVPPSPGAKFSGTFSVRYELEIVPASCPT